MPSAELSRRVGKVVSYPPLSELGDLQRWEFHEALLEADRFEDLPGEVAGGDPGGGPAPTTLRVVYEIVDIVGLRPAGHR